MSYFGRYPTLKNSGADPLESWIPAFAGMTERGGFTTVRYGELRCDSGRLSPFDFSERGFLADAIESSKRPRP